MYQSLSKSVPILETSMYEFYEEAIFPYYDKVIPFDLFP